MPRPANPDRVKTFKRPPQRSTYYAECMDNCDKINCPKLHYLKCDIPGCNFVASHEEQHSIAHGRLQQHKESGKCRIFQANAIITGNTVNTGGTLVIHNNYNEYPQLSGTLIPQSVATQRTLEKCVNHLVKQNEQVVEKQEETIAFQRETLVKTMNKAEKDAQFYQQLILEKEKEARIMRDLLFSIAGALSPEQTKKCSQAYKELRNFYNKNVKPIRVRRPYNLPWINKRLLTDILDYSSANLNLKKEDVKNIRETLYTLRNWCEEWVDRAEQDPAPIICPRHAYNGQTSLRISSKNFDEDCEEYPPYRLLTYIDRIIAIFEVCGESYHYESCSQYSKSVYDDIFRLENKRDFTNWIFNDDYTQEDLLKLSDWLECLEDEVKDDFKDIDSDSDIFKEE